MTGEVVYVLGTPGSNTVKIGRTTNLAKRVAEIQRMSPVPLAALWTHPGGHELETRLHRHFADFRSHGEWFAFRRDAVQLIQWAVEDEPWNRPKISLKKVKTKVKPVKPVPPQRAPVADLDIELSPALQEAYDGILRSIYEVPDPVERYKKAVRTSASIKQTIREARQEIVLKLKAEGRSWRQVGELLGVTGARAEQMSRCAR
jgi:hypothetical protein